jgi:3-deoxy-D-manno-octulosonic-acid transferase
LGIFLAQFFNPKAKKWIEGRKKWKSLLPKIAEDQEVIWFHCASLGEFDQGLPLMNKLKEENSNLFLCVSFFSPSGFENYNKRKHLVDFAFYLPLDTKSNMTFLMENLRPKKIFIVKYEFWCNLIFSAKKNKVQLYSVCAIFRENHRFFRWHGGIFRKALLCFNHLFVQTKISQDLLNSINITKHTLVGDMRFDSVIDNKNNLEKDLCIEQFLNNEKAFIIGSSWTIDECFLKNFVLNITKEEKIILAPHDIKESHITEIENEFKGKTIRYSQLENIQNSNCPILILDCIGKLSSAYNYGKIAYIGGGFTGSLHNILEPAVFGLPVIFGPKFKRFPEAQLFIDEGIGFSVSEENELLNVYEKAIHDLNNLNYKAIQLIARNKGVVEKIMSKI